MRYDILTFFGSSDGTKVWTATELFSAFIELHGWKATDLFSLCLAHP